MKRAAILLALVAPAIGTAQISTLRWDLPPLQRCNFHIAELRDFLVKGEPLMGERWAPPYSLAEVAVAAWQLVQVAEHVSLEETTADDAAKWRDRCWIFKWLREQVTVELEDMGVDLADYDACVEAIKQGLAKHGIIVEDPYARFSDVPEGHWADEAIHNLRKLGILRGYPDNTFRF
jgi:hypothetical protein